MKDLCGMCGEQESKQELCRSDNHYDRWQVCLRCAQIMLEDPILAGIWQRSSQVQAEPAGLGNVPAPTDGRTLYGTLLRWGHHGTVSGSP